MKTHGSVRELVHFGWRTLRSHSRLVFSVVLTILALDVARAVVEKVLQHTPLGTLASVVLMLLLMWTIVGATVISLKLARGAHARYQDLFQPWKLTSRFFLSAVLSGVITLIPLAVAVCSTVFAVLGVAGFALLSPQAAVPLTREVFMAHATSLGALAGVLALLLVVGLCATLYLALRLSFARFAVIDGASVVKSLRESRALTHGIFWRVALFFVTIAGLNMLGAITIVGLLVTMPISAIAYAHLYQTLRGRVEDVA